MALHALKTAFSIRGRHTNVGLRGMRPNFRLLLADRHPLRRYTETACKGSNGDRCVDPPDVRKLAKMAHISVTDEEVWRDARQALILFANPISESILRKVSICTSTDCR